jgi:hypothetical protein
MPINEKENLMKTPMLIRIAVACVISLTLSICLFAGISSASNGIITVTESRHLDNTGENVKKHILRLHCIADPSDGSYPAYIMDGHLYMIDGWLVFSTKYVPGAGGGTAPSNGVTITMLDNDNFPLDQGLLASMSSTAPGKLVNIGAGSAGYPIVDGKVTFAITGNTTPSAVIDVVVVFWGGN